MRLGAIVLVAVLACSSNTGGGSGDGDVRIRVRLENQDPHLYDVASVDLDLKRDNVVVKDRLAAAAGRVLDFPAEVIVKVPIGPGDLVVEATPRAEDGRALGGGEGQVTAAADGLAAVTVSLLSDRNRPTRGRVGAGIDAGLEPDAASPDGPGPGAGPDAEPEPCTPSTHRLPAVAVTSVDYGPAPRDHEDDRVSVSSGFAHDHVHSFVGWMRFELGGVPARARLTAARLSLVLVRAPTGVPALAVLYSSTDGWDPASLTSDTAEEVARTAPVSGDLGPPRPSRGVYALDADLYRPFFAADLADGAVTLGMITTTVSSEPEAWCDFYGLDPQELAPVLELETCE